MTNHGHPATERGLRGAVLAANVGRPTLDLEPVTFD
jgi:hypothetical protein